MKFSCLSVAFTLEKRNDKKEGFLLQDKFICRREMNDIKIVFGVDDVLWHWYRTFSSFFSWSTQLYNHQTKTKMSDCWLFLNFWTESPNKTEKQHGLLPNYWNDVRETKQNELN